MSTRRAGEPRTRHALVWWSLLLQVQIELQYFFAHAPVYVVAALHPVNAVLMFWITIHLARRGMKFLKQGYSGIPKH